MSTLRLPLQLFHLGMGSKFALPKRMSAQAAGFDLCAAIDAPLVLPPMGRCLVACGFGVALPPGYEAQIRPRSGLALKHGLSCLNSPGTIDADYRGEVKVLLVNFGALAYHVAPGERIAQMVICRLPQVELEVVAQLSASARGEEGFGSTGSKTGADG